jgi:hypothetical protein
MAVRSLKLINITESAKKGRIAKRIAGISNNVKRRDWALDSLSEDWDPALTEQLKQLVQKYSSSKPGQPLEVTDVQQIETYLFPKIIDLKHVKQQKVPDDDAEKALRNPSLGTAVLVNIPVIDLGAPDHKRYTDHLGLDASCQCVEDIPNSEYVRHNAFGYTYATLYVKQTGKQWERKNGKYYYAGPSSLKSVLICNNAADLWVGPQDKRTKRRSLENVPKAWRDHQNKLVDEYIKACKRGGSSASRGPKPPKKEKEVKLTEEGLKAEFAKKRKDGDDTTSVGVLLKWESRMKVPELRDACRSEGLKATGNKRDLILRLDEAGVLTDSNWKKWQQG